MTRKQKYDWFMSTLQWQELREDALIRDRRKCRWCGSMERLNVHHRFYRKKIQQTRVEDLITLCRKCHDEAHNIKRDELGNVIQFKQVLPVKYPNFDWAKHREQSKKVSPWRKYKFKHAGLITIQRAFIS